MIVDAGAVSCYVDYAPSFGSGPFGHYICTSVNDGVLHGLPHDRALADGDLLSLDLAVSLGGVVADSAISFVVGGAPTPEDAAMIDATERALAAGIAVAGPGVRLGDVSHAIGDGPRARPGSRSTRSSAATASARRCTRTRTWPTPGDRAAATRLRPGLLLALEPWVMADTAELVTDDDGWTLRSATGCRTAHSEHTIAVTDDGVEIMTLPSTS